MLQVDHHWVPRQYRGRAMGITVLLAHSVPGIRKLENALLEKEPDVGVVGENEDESTAMKLINSLQLHKGYIVEECDGSRRPQIHRQRNSRRR
jgi:hypothetical protein